jgi:hypothetical protein
LKRVSLEELNLAVIGFDSMQLLIPQGGIATIEMIDGMESGDGGGGAVGTLRAGGREYPVYALNADLELLTECSAAHKYCVAFNLDDQPAFAIACDEVRSLTLHAADEVKPLPACMRNPGNPVEAMLLQEDRLMLVSQIAPMLRFLTMDVAA